MSFQLNFQQRFDWACLQVFYFEFFHDKFAQTGFLSKANTDVVKGVMGILLSLLLLLDDTHVQLAKFQTCNVKVSLNILSITVPNTLCLQLHHHIKMWLKKIIVWWNAHHKKLWKPCKLICMVHWWMWGNSSPEGRKSIQKVVVYFGKQSTVVSRLHSS